MALHWQWSEKIGKAFFRDERGIERQYNLYQGNAYLIFLDEYEENGKGYYALYCFFADKDHMNNCLGLSKGSTPIFYDNVPYRIDLESSYSYKEQVAKSFLKWAEKYDHPLVIVINKSGD